jgi:hypothetical protein
MQRHLSRTERNEGVPGWRGDGCAVEFVGPLIRWLTPLVAMSRKPSVLLYIISGSGSGPLGHPSSVLNGPN